jgi:multimeric flavodoxin WrbA
MSNKILVLDGLSSGEGERSHVTDILTGVLAEGGDAVRVFSVKSIKLTNCIGCFGCWQETPGICRYREPRYQEIIEAWVHSDIIVLLTSVTFGGYSSGLKRIIERMLPVLLPYMSASHGEIHHRPRYSKFARLIGIGVQEIANTAEAETFKLVVGRHAVDMSAPSYAAEVLGANDDAEHMRRIFRALITRGDILPFGKTVKKIKTEGIVPDKKLQSDGVRRACLIVGSPKILSKSTSGVLGNYLLDRMKERGWETESLELNEVLNTDEGEAEVFFAVDRADLLIFAFPLYIDALPFRMTRALELISAHRRSTDHHRPVRLVAIANNGFPESYQNNPALSICRNFAESTGMIWLGALALGAGEAIISGEPLKERSHLGFPINNIHMSLRSASDALDKDHPIPLKAVHRLSGSPIPYTPFFIWRFLFLSHSGEGWEKIALKFGVSKQKMLAQPFEESPGAKQVKA